VPGRPAWRGGARGATLAAVGGLVAVLCGCIRTRTEFVPTLAPAVRPAPEVTEPASARGDASGPTAIAMRRVDFHVAPAVVLHVRHLGGELASVRPGAPVVVDDPRSFVLRIATADAGLTTADLGRLLNGYVFAYPGAPLIDLRVSAAGSQLRLRGTLRKGGDIRFDIVGAVSATPAGEIRVHPTTIRVARVSAAPLLRLVGLTLERLIDLRGSRGARVAGNDIYLQPDSILPPPRIRGHVTAARVERDEVRLTFDAPSLAPSAAAAAHPPDSTSNWVYFRHGTVQIGRLFMVDTDLELVDDAPADPFDFSLDAYRRQLVAGTTKNTPDGGLIVHAPDLRIVDQARPTAVIAKPAAGSTPQ